jgi:hypothetical protein
MFYAGVRQILHTCCSSHFTEVPGVIIGEAHDIESGINEVSCISGWCSEQVTGPWILALLSRLAVVHQDAFEIANRYVSRVQERCYCSQEADSVVIRQVILRIVSADHNVADSCDAE